MTPQEIFDKVWDHLNKQGKPAKDEDGACMYRTEDGLACAVGCLIDDETARIWDGPDGGNIFTIGNRSKFEKPEWVLKNLAFLLELQQAHDAASSRALWLTRWRERMAILAGKYGLTVPPIPGDAQ